MAFPHDERTSRAFERPFSFSLIHFDGDVQDHVPELLMQCGYRPVAEGQLTAPFAAAYDALQELEGPTNSIVLKGSYKVTGGLVLLDPEMLIALTHQVQLAAFCRQHGVRATAAIWERVSESLAHLEVGPKGLESRTYLVRGEPDGEQLKPSLVLAREPSPAGLCVVLASARIPVEEVFGVVHVRALKLDEGEAA